MLRSFWTHQYRNLQIPSPPKFGRLNLLIGPNNSGKSNFIKAMGFLRDMLRGEVEPSPSVKNFLQTPSQTAFLQTAAQHGRGDVLNRTIRARNVKEKLPQEVQFDWLLESQSARKIDENMGPADTSVASDILYRLGYAVGESDSFPAGFFLRHEVVMRCPPQNWWTEHPLTPKHYFVAECHVPPRSGSGRFEANSAGEWKLSGLARVEIPVDTKETVLRQAKVLLREKSFYEKIFPEFDRLAEELLGFAHGFHSYSSTEVNLGKLKEGARTDLSIRTLDSEGAELVNVLRYLDQRYDFLDEYSVRLREVLSDLKRLKVVDVSETSKQLELHIGGQKYKPREMSDGTLKALWLALLLFSPEKGSLLSVDEPELNLHPAWLKVIGGWLQRFTSAEQLFVSTHSPDLLDTFTEGFKSGDVALFVFGLGEKVMRRVEPAELESFFKDGWELGDMYRQGVPQLGGWPW